jgi:hypothetical protein
MLAQCDAGAFGELIIPKRFVERWQRQQSTEYSELPEGEKESDLKQADRILAVFVADETEQELARSSPTPKITREGKELSFTEWLSLMIVITAAAKDFRRQYEQVGSDAFGGDGWRVLTATLDRFP